MEMLTVNGHKSNYADENTIIVASYDNVPPPGGYCQKTSRHTKQHNNVFTLRMWIKLEKQSNREFIQNDPNYLLENCNKKRDCDLSILELNENEMQIHDDFIMDQIKNSIKYALAHGYKVGDGIVDPKSTILIIF
jgi:hypothetical protein